jgi:Uma2 family endonuclease
MTTKPLKTGATYDDLREVPDHFVAEMFDGDLYATPRPALPHTRAASVLGVKLGGPFDRKGPGGWVILDEPELHFGNDVPVPDLAGWRRERLPAVPADAYMTLAPEQTLEVLSLESGKWTMLESHAGRLSVRAPPFAAIELELGALWI